MDKLNYIYQSGIICDRTGADFSLSEKIVGYALSESDFYNLGVEIAENLYCALCSLVRKGLHDETFAIIDSIYKMNKPNRAAPEGDPARREGGTGSDDAEHVIVGAHRVVVHKQLASEGFVVEVAGEVAHLSFEIVALADDVPGKVFLAVPLAAVGFLEVAEFVVELHIIIDGLLANAIGGMS